MTDLVVMRVRGSQTQMGEQHGALLRAIGGFDAAVDFYTDLPARMLLGGVVADRLAPLVRAAVRPALDCLLAGVDRARPAEYRARSRAFFAALGVPVGHARFLGVVDIFQNLVGLAGRFGVGPFGRIATAAAPPACSTLAVWGEASAGGFMRHARNFDFPGIGVWDRAPAVVLCDPDHGLRYGFTTTRGADVPGVTAFNEQGITVTAHTRFHREVRFDGAAVVDVGHDIVRRARTLDDAIAIARRRRLASTWGLAISSANERRAAVVETTGAQTVVVPGGRDHLTCANRYRHTATQRGEVAASAMWAEHSDAREARLDAAVDAGREHGGLDTAALEQLLGDHIDARTGECRVAGGILSQAATVQSVIVEPEARQLRISVGEAPTGWGPYVTVPWVWDGAVGVDHVPAPPSSHRDEPLWRAATRRFVEATRLAGSEHDYLAARREVEAALALTPDEPSLRLLAGILCLREGDPEMALAHLERGIVAEREPFRAGALALWASRAASLAGRPERASVLRATVERTRDPRLAAHRTAARRERAHPLSARAARHLSPNFLLIDA